MRLQPERRVRREGLNNSKIERPEIGTMRPRSMEASRLLLNQKGPDFPVCGFIHD